MTIRTQETEGAAYGYNSPERGKSDRQDGKQEKEQSDGQETEERSDERGTDKRGANEWIKRNGKRTLRFLGQWTHPENSRSSLRTKPKSRSKICEIWAQKAAPGKSSRGTATHRAKLEQTTGEPSDEAASRKTATGGRTKKRSDGTAAVEEGKEPDDGGAFKTSHPMWRNLAWGQIKLSFPSASQAGLREGSSVTHSSAEATEPALRAEKPSQ